MAMSSGAGSTAGRNFCRVELSEDLANYSPPSGAEPPPPSTVHSSTLFCHDTPPLPQPKMASRQSSLPIAIPPRKALKEHKSVDNDSPPSPSSPLSKPLVLGKFLKYDLQAFPNLPPGRPRAVSRSIAELVESEQWTNLPSPERTTTFSRMSSSPLPRPLSQSTKPRRQSLLTKKSQLPSQVPLSQANLTPPSGTDEKKDRSDDKEVAEEEEQQTTV